jgi:hypothetical protein
LQTIIFIFSAFNAYATCEGAVYRTACNVASGNFVCNVTVVGINAGSEHLCQNLHQCGPITPDVHVKPIDWLRNKAAALIHHQ